ncbi:hypothetical protein OQA88_4213 [Cercophora sp. LCS_1]
MPPHLPRPAVAGLHATLSSVSALPTCAVRHQFTTSSHLRTVTPYPPESPKYIRLPIPPQSTEPRYPPKRGHLPVPRQVFAKDEDVRKAAPEYAEAATPVSAAEQAGIPPKSVNEAKHRIYAGDRRKALVAGLQGLYERKQAHTKRVEAKKEARGRINRAAALAPEPFDSPDALTRSSVLKSTALDTKLHFDRNRFARAREAAEGHQAKMAFKAEQRRDALMQLYVAAGDFIVDESELEQRVEREFKTDAFSQSFEFGASIWDVTGPPVSISQLKSELAGNTSARGLTNLDSSKMVRRHAVVAEELTGGKLGLEQ